MAAVPDRARQAFRILYVGFVVAPILAGLDKFFEVLVDWDRYLAPVVPDVLPVSGHTFMLVVGVIEIAAGILVAVAPRIGGYVVAVWLWVIIVNLLILGDYFDVALRDFGLSLGALALARLAEAFPNAGLVPAPPACGNAGDQPRRPGAAGGDRRRPRRRGPGRHPPPFTPTTFPNNGGYDELVVARSIPFASLCQHHLLPFHGLAHVGYLPGDRVVGLSKLARMVEWFARDRAGAASPRLQPWVRLRRAKARIVAPGGDDGGCALPLDQQDGVLGEVHLIWCSKYRRRVLVGGVDQRVKVSIGDVAAEVGAESSRSR
jgi:GTP cyclohydrolase I